MFPAASFSEIFTDNPINYLFGVSLLIGAIYAAFLMFFHGIGDVLGDLDMDLSADHDLGDMQLIHAEGAHQATGISTLAIAGFVTAFGTFGLLSTLGLGLSAVLSVFVALVAGLVIGIAGQVFFLYILSPTISSEVRQARLIGMVAEIVTPIPAHGVGQIAFVAEGSRMTYTARAEAADQGMARGTAVRIERIVGGTAYVSPVE